jgi:PAS domain S-box-containing protein
MIGGGAGVSERLKLEGVGVAEVEFALALRGIGESVDGGTSVADRERILRALMGRLPAMVYRCADDPQWTMEFVSAGARELTGYASEELVGNARLAYADLIAPWHCEAVCRDIEAAIKKDNAWTISYPIITATGERKWVWERGVAVLDAEGMVLALEGLIVDMTAEHEAEEALELDLSDWQRMFDALEDSVAVLDADGTVVRANAATATLTGRAMDAIVGAPCAEVFHGTSAAHPDCPRMRALRSGRTESSCARQDGRWLRVTFTPTSGLDARADGGVHVVADVTDLMRSRDRMSSEASRETRAPVGSPPPSMTPSS